MHASSRDSVMRIDSRSVRLWCHDDNTDSCILSPRRWLNRSGFPDWCIVTGYRSSTATNLRSDGAILQPRKDDNSHSALEMLDWNRTKGYS
ncbi:uncharacterized protein LOC111519676 isoform X2 [Drosophila willistoni]|uniref:uncharacterized protein LOC111519676 isoform X2 n=1 Tax=Drosophila willistoni TaxID=7260 RepID=UPI001F0786CD|nr:uncharacterized protein LOC111519676 isoform X2 [Drosophila willistoni]